MIYERVFGIDKDGNEHAILTHVFWADPLVPVDGQQKVQLP